MPDNENNQGFASNFLEGTIEKFAGKMAVIITKDGQQLLWPIANLPNDSEAGQPVRLVLSTSISDTEDKEKLAKTILNEILKDTD
jgi:hypothetical protein